MLSASGQATAVFDLTPEIEDIISSEFENEPTARVLLARFLACAAYSPDFVEELIGVAAGPSGASWELRRACVLMLENQLLRLAAEDLDEHRRVLRVIGLASSDTRDQESISKLRHRLSRLSRVHRPIIGQKTTAASLADFLHVARQECKLTLARYFFQPQEVAARLVSLVRVSTGVVHWVPSAEDREEDRMDIGEYEQAVIAALSPESKIYWTGHKTPSAINSLVESPLGTVVLVIKLPGSDLELEIKRTGVRGPHPLQIKMPNERRLFGGSSGGNLEVEASSALRLAQLYEGVHGREAPVSMTQCTSSIQTIPAWQGEAHLVDYFSDRATYGNGYGLMRSAMDEAMRRFEPQGPRLNLPGPIGLTVRYLHRMLPRQSWLRGSTAFRLDLLERYLSSEGPSAYFTELQRLIPADHTASPSAPEPCCTHDEARRFADDLLEEILGVFVPPTDCSGPYSEYVERAMALPENRSRADAVYLSLLCEVGLLWGTLLATWGCSHGESFVRRNVGLKSLWRNGIWQVRIIFMDHDILWVPGQSQNDFDPKVSLEGILMDSGYLFEHKSAPNQQRGVIGTLERIYRIEPSLQSAGATVLEDALAEAYRKTRREMVSSPNIRRMFSGTVLANMADWEAIVWDRLESEKAGLHAKEWLGRTIVFLRERGYTQQTIEKWMEQVEGYLDLLTRYSYLFDPKYLDFNLSYKHPAG
ncbi:MAG TPA: hypothetical protein VI636_14945 [Candidatus Angelobacter sp.]